MKPFSEACERNRGPILAILKRVFAQRRSVLEIGSGTGQHAAYFAPELPHLVWQASDIAENLPGIREWVSDPPPIELDVNKEWPKLDVDAVFSANTCHIMSWPQVERLFAGVGGLLPAGGVFALYGPFNYGKHTSESNARFDAMLRARDPASGVRDLENINALAEREGLSLAEDNAMPANNRLLVFTRGELSGRRRLGDVSSAGVARRSTGRNRHKTEGVLRNPLMAFTAVYFKALNGYVGFVEELPGVNSQGRTIEEARANLQRLAAVVFEEERAQSAALVAGKEVVREEFRVELPRRNRGSSPLAGAE